MNANIDVPVRAGLAAFPAPPLNAAGKYTVSYLECLECDDPESAIAIKDLSVNYGAATVLSGITTTVHKGCITALIGPSGCGKTTFLSCLNRLIDLVPGARVKGRIQFDGEDIFGPGYDTRTLRRRIGMVFQRPNPFPFSVRRNFEIPLIEHGVTVRADIEERMESVLRDVGLWNEVKDKLDKSALALSGGQQQRLSIARALALDPEILLMDEPCSALDPASAAVVEALIASMRSKYTIVIVTHNLAQARRIANYVAFFWVQGNSGALIEFGACCKVFENPSHALTASYVSGMLG